MSFTLEHRRLDVAEILVRVALLLAAVAIGTAIG